MITRRSARYLAELMELTFRESRTSNGRRYFGPAHEELYDFLFDNDYAAWFCNASKTIPGTHYTRGTKDFFMKVHTGETLLPATKEWKWEQREALGQRYLTDLADDILTRWKAGPRRYEDHIKEPLADLIRSLELDGYKWNGQRLIVGEAEVLDTAEEAGVIQTLYRELSLGDEKTTFHHLQLTEDHYIAGRWDDSIANSRKFLEATLSQIASRHAASRGSAVSEDILSRPVRVRDYLEREGLLEEKEQKAVAAVYGLLSETGGHPYIAKHEEARLMRHLALTFAQFAMLRLRSALAPA